MRRLKIKPGGTVEFVHDDKLTSVMKPLGTVEIRRASHVEPTTDGEWTADMSPSGGPTLGPFPTRTEALAAERQWLRDNKGL